MLHRRALKLLTDTDLERLMCLTIEAFDCANGCDRRLLDAYMALAAECGFELWWRRQDAQLHSNRALSSSVARQQASRSLN